MSVTSSTQGETIEIDWSGPTMQLADPTTGEIEKANLFVAVLLCFVKTMQASLPSEHQHLACPQYTYVC